MFVVFKRLFCRVVCVCVNKMVMKRKRTSSLPPVGGAISMKKRRVKKKSYQSSILNLRGLQMPKSACFPPSLKCNFVYREQNDLTVDPGAAGITGVYVFSANGLYDPNITGTGHQPTGFDQLMQFYDHYTVIASKITVTFFNGNASNTVTGLVSVMDTSSTNSDIQQYIENGRCAFEELDVSSNSQLGTVTLGCSVSDFLGRKNILSEDNCRGSASANPSEEAYFHVVAAPWASNDVGTIAFVATIEYTAVLTERKSTSIS